MIETWSQGRPDQNMPEAILVDLAGVIRRHPWWRARLALLLALLERLDVLRPAASSTWVAGGESCSTCWSGTATRPSAWISPWPRWSGSTGPEDADRGGPHPAAPRPRLPDPRRARIDVMSTWMTTVPRWPVWRARECRRGVVVLGFPAACPSYSLSSRWSRATAPLLPEPCGPRVPAAASSSNTSFGGAGGWSPPEACPQAAASPDGRVRHRATRRYLRIPPWPSLALPARLSPRSSDGRLQGRLRLGTSLFAVGPSNPLAPRTDDLPSLRNRFAIARMGHLDSLHDP